MRVITETVGEEGMESLLGEQVFIVCSSYFYVGKLVGVNKSCIKLANPAKVYETGEWNLKTWKDCQPMGMPVGYVQISAIEFFGKSPK